MIQDNRTNSLLFNVQFQLSISYEKIYFCAKQKASLKSQKKGVKGTPHFVLGAYSSLSILRLALSITSVFKEAR